MSALMEEAIPVLDIKGKDYSLVKLPAEYQFYDSEASLVLNAVPAIANSWSILTSKGRVGDLRREGQAWVLYEGPIRSRHVIALGLDNAMIQAAKIIIAQGD